MSKVTSILMRGEQHIIRVDKDKFNGAGMYSICVDNKGRQIVYLSENSHTVVMAKYKLSPVYYKPCYTYWIIGLHKSFLSYNKIGKGDKVLVEYRKDKVVISAWRQ